jgi:hypothetical protein
MNKEILFHTGLIVLWIFFPIFSVFPISIYLAVTKTSKYNLYFYLGLLALVPALINSTKVPVSDLAYFYEAFDDLYEKGLTSFLEEKRGDIFFYAGSYIMSKIVFGNNNLILLLWTFIIYFNCFLSLFEFVKNDKKQCKCLLIACVYITIFWGVSFTMAGHLLRQFVSMSFILLSLAMFNNGSKKYIIYLILGCLSHFSVIVFVLFFILSKIKIPILIIIFPVILFASFVLGESNTLPMLVDYFPEGLIKIKAIVYQTKNDGEHSSFYLIIFSLISIFFTIKAVIEKDRYYFWLVYVSYCALLLFFRNNDLLFLRYSYCYKFFSILILYKILCIKYFRVLFSLLLVIYTPFYFFKGIMYCPWQYITNDPLSLCLTNVFDYLFFPFGKFIIISLLFTAIILLSPNYFIFRKNKNLYSFMNKHNLLFKG